jgi:hypothetical protein
VDVDYFAQFLLEQDEAKEFVAINVDRIWFRSVVMLGSHLLRHVRDAYLEESEDLDQDLGKDRARVVLEIWGKSVYPVLKTREINSGLKGGGADISQIMLFESDLEMRPEFYITLHTLASETRAL